MVAGMLRTHGIEAIVSSDDAGGMQGGLQTQGARVLVAEDDADEARQLIEDSEGRAATSAPAPLNALQSWLVRMLRRS